MSLPPGLSQPSSAIREALEDTTVTLSTGETVVIKKGDRIVVDLSDAQEKVIYSRCFSYHLIWFEITCVLSFIRKTRLSNRIVRAKPLSSRSSKGCVFIYFFESAVEPFCFR